MDINIDRVLRKRHMTKAELADKLGITRQSLHASLRVDARISTIEKIANAIGCEVSELFASPQEKSNSFQAMVCCKGRVHLCSSLDELKILVDRLEKFPY